MEKEQRILFAKRVLANFKATLVLSNEHFLVFDWRNPKSGNMSARYIVDKDKGTLIISGDSGDCIATWFGHQTAQDIYDYVDDEQYFIEKIQTTSHLYSFDLDDVEMDIQELENELIRHCNENEWSFEDVLQKLEEKGVSVYCYNKTIPGIVNAATEIMRDWFYENHDILEEANGNVPFPDKVFDMLRAFDDVWYECGLATDIGARVSSRITLWRLGYRMGYEQLQAQCHVMP